MRHLRWLRPPTPGAAPAPDPAPAPGPAPAVNPVPTPTPAPAAANADGAATMLIAKLQKNVTAKNWTAVSNHLRQLEAVQNNGFNNTTLSADMQPKVADAVTTYTAMLKIAASPAPKTPVQFLTRAGLEMDAHLLPQAQMDLNKVAGAMGKLNFFQKIQYGQAQARLAQLETAAAQGG